MPKFPKPLWPDEEFKLIPEFEGYCISSYGRVFSRRSRGTGQLNSYWVRLKTSKASNGYLSVSLQQDKKGVTKFVHSTVLEVFVGNRPSNYDACHLDGNKLNNVLHNLRWDTKSNNAKDKHLHGTAKRSYMFGENQTRSKLTDADVKQIRFKVFLGSSRYELAKEFGVDYRTICHVVNGVSWSHIKGWS